MKILGVLLFAIGFLIYFYGLYWILIIRYSENWVSIFGKIVSINIKKNEQTSNNKALGIEIFYEYIVKNKTYVNNRIFILGKLYSSNNDLITSKFKKGSPIEIFYNPKYPNKSLLIRQDSNAGLLFLFFGLIINGIGFAILFNIMNNSIKYLLNLIEII